MAGTADGDTAYVITAALINLIIDLGNEADGRRLFVANVDAANAVQVECSGAAEGDRLYLLTAKGDYIYVPGGDFTRVTITPLAYPCTVAYARLTPRMDIGTGQKR